MNRVVFASVMVILALTSLGGAQVPCAADSVAERALTLVVGQRYAEAESLLVSAADSCECDARLHFTFVSLYFAWLDDYGIADSLAGLFDSHVSRALACTDAELRERQEDPSLHYYRGLTLLYHGMLRSRIDGIGPFNAFSLMSEASDGLESLRKVREFDPSDGDALLALGNYRYWKGSRLPWPLGTETDRRDGIAMMEDAVSLGLNSEVAGVEALGWAYLREERYADLLALVEPLLSEHPARRPLLTQKTRALMGLGRLDEARVVLECAVNGLTSAERNRPFVRMQMERWLALLAHMQGDDEEACRRARDLLGLDYTGVHESWLVKKLSVVRRISAEACMSGRRATN